MMINITCINNFIKMNMIHDHRKLIEVDIFEIYLRAQEYLLKMHIFS